VSHPEIGGSIKRDVNKKASPSAGSERFFSGLLFCSLGSFSSGDNVVDS
jgi:hypothetical protein